MFGCEMGRDRGLPIARPYRRGGPDILVECLRMKQRFRKGIQPVEGAI